MPVLVQVSAGGVAFRKNDGENEVAIVSVSPSGRWQLPKGLVDQGETLEQAAAREVREEAGIVTEVVGPLDKVEYWFVTNWDEVRTRIHKTVHFFFLRYISGDTADHDHEILEARWVGAEKAIEMLAFDSEKDVVRKALTMIGDLS
jgi:8-oxo-dGTP pyrophosphatase MutT (NUDIX family)